MNALPASWRVVAAWVHPMSGEPIVIVSVGGVPLAWHLDGAIGSVPWNWRDTPPDACGLVAARALADHLRASQVRDDEAADGR